MFKKSIEAIVSRGHQDLSDQVERISFLAREAQKEVENCRGEVAALVQLAKDVPEKTFDRYSSVMVSSVEVAPNDSSYPRIQFGHARGPFDLRGLMGDEQIKPGKYRVVVLLERLE